MNLNCYFAYLTIYPLLKVELEHYHGQLQRFEEKFCTSPKDLQPQPLSAPEHRDSYY